MIDPLTAQVLLKLADAAILGVTAWQNSREADDSLQVGIEELHDLKGKLSSGAITVEEADNAADFILVLLMKPLDDAIARL